LPAGTKLSLHHRHRHCRPCQFLCVFLRQIYKSFDNQHYRLQHRRYQSANRPDFSRY